jgi:hypothetical protein
LSSAPFLVLFEKGPILDDVPGSFAVSATAARRI